MNRRTFIGGAVGVLGAAVLGAAWRYPWAGIGAAPEGDRLARILASPHYCDGMFRTLEPVTEIVKGGSSVKGFLEFAFGDKSHLAPHMPMVTAKSDLHALHPAGDVVVWMGHSSYYFQIAGHRILIDPVFSDYGSPVSFVNRAYAGTTIYRAEDIPPLDLIAISHDHWDHLDYPTILSLKDRTKSFVCPLGVGAHLEHWGVSPDRIYEGDWDDAFDVSDRLQVHITPSQHFSGRTWKRNQTLWCGFAFVSKSSKVYYSGDGGYGKHFKAIGKAFGGFDLACVETGQYDPDWPKIHLMPEESAKVGADVRAKTLLSMHNSRFTLARHIWTDPHERITAAAAGREYALLTPLIGETVHIGDRSSFRPWWREMA